MEGSFLRNLTISISGNGLAIVIGFLFTPFIARLYTPEAYGTFAFFLSLTQNIALIATLQLPRAFVLPETESEYRTIAHASIVSAAVIIGLTVLFLILFGHSLFYHLNIPPEDTGFLIGVIPVSVLVYSVNDILKSANVRRKFFGKNALAQTASSTVSRSAAVVFGLSWVGNGFGLIVSDLVGKLSEIVLLGKRLTVSALSGVLTFSRSDFLSTIAKYRTYPLFILPGFWLQSIIMQLPIYFALLFFGSASAGQYSFANSLLSLPVNILAGAVAPVFLQKASDTFRREPFQMGRIVESLANKLFFAGLLPLVFLIVFADYVFTFVLGDQWVVAGEMASYMGVYFLLLTLNYPLVSLYRIYGKERLSFILNVLAFVLTITALSIGAFFQDFVFCIALFSMASVMHYLINLYFIFKIAGLRPLRIIFNWAIYFFVAYTLASLVRRVIEYQSI